MSLLVRPTPAGAVVAVGLVGFMVLGPEVNDPYVAGFVWAAAFGLLLVGLVWPCAAAWSLGVRSAATTGGRLGGIDARAVRCGSIVPVRVSLGHRTVEVTVRWVGDEHVVVVPAGPPCEVEVPLTARRRGRFDVLGLQVRSDGPFGVAVACRTVEVPIRRPLVVGPARATHGAVPVPAAAPHGDTAAAAVGHGGDTTRSVRPYVTGDPAHLVHWPTSARVGAVVVREMEPPGERSVAVVVDLGPARQGGTRGRARADLPTVAPDGPQEAVEEVVARAGAAVEELLGRGARVVLCTAAPEPVTAEVADEHTVVARLAVAGAGAPGRPPDGWPVQRFATGTSDAVGSIRPEDGRG